MNTFPSRLWRDRRGGIGGLFGLLATVAFLAFVVDVGSAYVTRVAAQQHVDKAAKAAANLALDMDALARGEVRLDPAVAAAAFYYYLQKNLYLDPANRPLPGSYVREVRVKRVDVLQDDTASILVEGLLDENIRGPLVYADLHIRAKNYVLGFTDVDVPIKSVAAVRVTP